MEPGKLFPVGDPKQSIYRFRRADLRIYDQAREALAESGSGPIGALKHNFRSHPGLLEWVNIFDGGPVSQTHRLPARVLGTRTRREVAGAGAAARPAGGPARN